MPLVSSKKMLKDAYNNQYAIGHFNTSNLEFTQAIINAAEKLNSPVMIATSKDAIKYAGYQPLAAIVATLAKKAKVPVALHLDHGPDFTHVRNCVKYGWTSIMRDASALPYKQNIKEMQKAVKLCHKHKIPVEAELGKLAGEEGWVKEKESVFTDPDQARDFIKQTKCDFLAVSIGTSHGAFKFAETPKLDIKRLKEIVATTQIPLVLHGASEVPKDVVAKAKKLGAKFPKTPTGVPVSQVRRAIKHGIAKVNTDTDLRLEFLESTRAYLKRHPEVFNPRKILGSVREELQKQVERHIKHFNGVGTA